MCNIRFEESSNKKALHFTKKKTLVLNEVFVPHSVISPIDGKSMESIISTKMFQKSEYKENGKIIRWTEVQMLILNMTEQIHQKQFL